MFESQTPGHSIDLNVFSIKYGYIVEDILRCLQFTCQTNAHHFESNAFIWLEQNH